MPRPESVDDIDLDNIEIATIHVDAIGLDAELLTGYANFLKSVEKAKAIAVSHYNGVVITRRPNAKEQADQLKTKQSSWDEGKKQYEIFASVGSCEYTYLENTAKRHAESEGLPWPPEVEPIALSDTLDRIDAVVGE